MKKMKRQSHTSQGARQNWLRKEPPKNLFKGLIQVFSPQNTGINDRNNRARHSKTSHYVRRTT